MSKTFQEATRLYNSDAYHGLMTNPFFEISQENGTTQSTLHNYYFADQWRLVTNSTNCTSYSNIATGLLNNSIDLQRFNTSGVGVTTTAKSSYSSGEYIIPFDQSIEGTFIKQLGWGTTSAQNLDVLLIFFSNWSGSAALTVTNSAQTRTYTTNFSVNFGNNIVMVTVPGDTTGTWPNSNSTGMRIRPFSLSGSTYHIPTSSWQALGGISNSAATNWTSTLTNSITIYYCNAFPSGILPFRDVSNYKSVINFILNNRRPVDQELRRCMRYYEIGSQPQSYFGGASYNAIYGTIQFMIDKRATPAITTTGWTIFVGATDQPSAPSISSTSTKFFTYQYTGTGFSGINSTGLWYANARL